MQNRVNKVLIGKELARTESLVIYGATQNLAEGEVFVADKNKDLLTSGATIADSDTIYIGVGGSRTFDYTLPDGTAVTGEREILWSAPIKGALVKTYLGLSADSAATERSVTIDITAATTFAPVVGEEYVIRVVYKDIPEHPGQFTETFRVIAETTTPGDLTDLFVAEVNKIDPSGENDSRVTATNSAGDLVLTGKVIPYNDSNDEINEYQQVDFDAFLFSDNFDDVEVADTTYAHPGNGNPKLVRDKEKIAQSYEGVTNRTWFPVIKPAMSTEMTKWYDTILIEHSVDFVSADNEYVKYSPLTTELYIPAGAAQTSTDPTLGQPAVLSSLNTWMASTPKAFANVSV